MKDYVVVPFKTGCISGSLDSKKLQDTLNEYGHKGWKLSKTIHETQQVFFGVQREAHFLIFERSTGSKKQVQGHQPNAQRQLQPGE